METQTKSNLARKVLVGGAVIAIGAWCGAEKIAEWSIDDYKGAVPKEPGTVPSIPEKPEPISARRRSIEVAIGFDISKSDIKNKLPSVVSETRKFLDDTGVLQNGDKVSICTFVENAECREFQLPDQETALLSYVDGIQLDPRKPNEMHTYVHASVKQILDQTGADMVFAWTDGFDEDQSLRQELGADHSPVVIVVPDSKYVADANSVKQTLGSRGVDVKVAATSDEFGKDLENFTGELNAEAQTKAKQDAEKLYKKKLAQYGEEMRQHQDALKKFEQDKTAYEKALEVIKQQKAVIEAKIQTVKNWIKVSTLGLFVIFAGIAGYETYERNRPKIHGFLEDKRNPKYPRVYRLPSNKGPYNCKRMIGANIILTPTKQGVTVDGKVLKNGDQLIAGVYYTVTDPRSH